MKIPVRALRAAGACLLACLASRLPAAMPEHAGERTALLRAWGWSVAHDPDLEGVELTAAERKLFLAGAERQLAGQPAPARTRAVFADVEILADARRAKVAAAARERNECVAERFLSQLDQEAHVVRLPSGLRYEVLVAGVGQQPHLQQTAVVRYVGRRLDGTEFIEMGPYEMILVPNRVSRALFEGVQHLAPGGKLKLYVPPALLAGEEAKLGIAPGSAVTYELELLELRSTAPEDLANSLLPPAPEPPPPVPSGAPESEVITTWGWSVAQKTGAASFKLPVTEIDAFIDGLDTGLRGGKAPSPSRADVRAFVADERRKVREALKQKRLEAMATFFNELKQKPTVVEAPSGLRYEVLQPGTGPSPKPGQIVVVDYVGRLLDGTVFDRTDNEPLQIQVGSVIDGFNEGIQKIRAGGRIRLFVPPTLGYGEEDMSGVISKIPAYSTLIYEIKLLDVRNADQEAGNPSMARDAIARTK